MTVLLPALRPVLRPVLRGPFDPSPGGVSIETLKSLLFGAGQKGGLYVASDDGTNFENSSGTTAISTVEKPVGYWTDRSGNGYHLTQATGTARPVLSARYNFMASSEFPNGLTDMPIRGGALTVSAMAGYAGA